VPTAVLLTEPFVGSGQMMAASHGCPDFPFAVIPHPIATQPDGVLQAWADTVTPAVLGMLRRA